MVWWDLLSDDGTPRPVTSCKIRGAHDLPLFISFRSQKIDSTLKMSLVSFATLLCLLTVVSAETNPTLSTPPRSQSLCRKMPVRRGNGLQTVHERRRSHDGRSRHSHRHWRNGLSLD